MPQGNFRRFYSGNRIPLPHSPDPELCKIGRKVTRYGIPALARQVWLPDPEGYIPHIPIRIEFDIIIQPVSFKPGRKIIPRTIHFLIESCFPDAGKIISEVLMGFLGKL